TPCRSPQAARPRASIEDSRRRSRRGSGIRWPCLLLYLDFDWAFWGVDARPHRLAVLTADLPVAQVADATRAQRAHARVTDPLATAERQLEPGLLPAHEDRLGAIGLDGAVA